MKLALFDQLEELLLVSVPTAERGEAAQQDVEDDTQSPDVHFNTVTCREEPAGQSGGCNACVHLCGFHFFIRSGGIHRPVSQRISGATYVGVPHIVKTGSVTTMARPKSPSFSLQMPAASRSI